MSDEQRRRLRIGEKPRQYVVEARRHFTREQLLEYLIKNKFTSRLKLIKGRKVGEPKAYDYCKEFGNWENARATAFGIKPMDFGFNSEFLTKSVVEFNLWTANAYRKKRKLFPDVLPPLYKVLKKWHTYKMMVASARQLSLKATLEAYRKLQRRLGRIPTTEEARLDGIPLDDAIAYYDGKYKLDMVMSIWKDENEGEARSS